MEAPPVQYVQTSDGYNIAYAVCGKGIPLVRVPSLFSHFTLQWNRGILDHDFRTLSDHFELVLFDSRGQGASTRGLADGTALEDYLRDLEFLVDRLELDRFILLGMSAMGKVAVSYALKHPDRTLALLLHGYSDLYRGSRLAIHELMQSDWPLYLQTCARVGWPWADSASVVSVLRECMTQEDHHRQYLALKAAQGDEMLQLLEVPALVMATREESRPVGGEEEARRLAALIPGARLVVFEDVSGGFRSPDAGLAPIIVAIQSLLERHAGRETRGSQPRISSALLSSRELEVLRLIAAGRSNPQIAEELVISLNTVQRHVSNILAKTGAANRTEAAIHARDKGLA
jgi:pimeloyl-ACP methyl ester carboxylesterase/DNA-binding CsgD family transcriptional regulator